MKRKPPILKIENSVWRVFERYVQTGERFEAGGILLGEYSPLTNEWRLCFATRPGGQDRRARRSFKRNAERSTRLARYLWKLSGGTIHYLGEWHTHSERFPTPSWRDVLSMKKLHRSSTVVAGALILIIVGTRT